MTLSRCAALLALLAAACGKPQPCPEPLVECNGQCIDVQSNSFDCGSCGNACVGSEVCVGGSCTAGAPAACSDRTGGAFVTLDVCASAVKAWITNAAFIDEAATYVGTTVTPRIPLLTVDAGTDCDAQWSWKVDAASPSWVTTAPAGCIDTCPADIESAVRGQTLISGSWCPTPTPSLVVAVDRR